MTGDTALKRWWGATVWLWLCLIANAINVPAYFLILLKPELANGTPYWVHIAGLFITIGQAICLVGLLKWLKLGWWGLVVLGVFTFVINLITGRIWWKVLFGAAGVAVSYLVMQFPRDGGSTWSRLH